MKLCLRFLLFLSTVLMLASPARAQILTPTTLSTAASQPTGKVGAELDLLVKAKIQTGWHLYSTDFSDEVGPAVFTLTFIKNPGYTLVGKPRSVGSKQVHDDVFNGEVAFFEKTGLVRQRIRLLKAGPLTIRATADFQSCSGADGRCVPGSSALVFGPLRVAAKARAAVALPARPTTPPVAAMATPVKATGPAKTAASRRTAVEPLAAAPVGLTPAAAIPSAQVASAPGSPASAMLVPVGTGLWGFGLLAFLSGLAALLTPCVFPMVPLTVSLFTGNDDSRRRGILKALVYGASIIGIYTGVGVGVARLLGAEGPNFLATHWLPNLLFFAVFVAFGLSFLGLFEITLPSGLVNRADRQADKGGWGGIFFAAFTLVLVSFSCTGPIVATVLSLSARGETLRPVVGMVGFSLAFALPFTLFAIFPSWLKSLPRAGGWLNTVKVTLGFVELGLALKFLSTVDLTYHWHLLPRDLYLVLWVALGMMLALYLLGKLRLAHDSEVLHLSVVRVLATTAVLAFTVYLVPGLFGAPLPLLAGYLPPQTSQDFSLTGALGGTATAPMPIVAVSRGSEPPRFSEFLELPLGLRGYFDLEQARRVARQQHKPLFIDFTGHGCVNCRKMEATVWSDPTVLAHLRNDFVVVALYVDDKTELPAADWYTSVRDQRVKKTLGQQNADLQLTRYGVNAQPYYVLLDPDQDGFVPLVSSVAYEPNAARFAQFLAAGVRRYQAPPRAIALR